MSDLIRRQDAIDVFEILADKMSDEGQTVMAQAVAVLKDLRSAEPERTAKATRRPEAFFYRCECGYGLCCEKNDMNYCPMCGCRLEWE